MTDSSSNPTSANPSTSSLPRLLVVGPLPPGLTALLTPRYSMHPLWQEADKSKFLAENKGRFVGGATMSRHGGSAEVMACLEGTVLGCFGVGFEGIDLEAAKKHNVAVSTTPDVLTDCVADIAFGLMLATARQIVAGDRFVQAGKWPTNAFPLSTKVSGKKLGIVGLGRIGSAIARRGMGFDMSVKYFGRRAHPGVQWTFESDLIELAKWSDFLVLACRGGPETHHLISAKVLEALGPKGILINIARGSVVDEAALIDAIDRGVIGGAGLDVFEKEPQVPAGLLGKDQVVVLPHVAAMTKDTRAAMEKLVLDNLLSFFETGKVLTPPG